MAQFTFVFIFLLSGVIQAYKLNTRVDIKPPSPKEVEHKIEKHGDIRLDEFFWLKDRANPEVIKYLTAENKYVEKIFEPTEDLQATLFKEMRGRIKEDDSTYPLKDGPYYYYTRFEKNKQYPVHARKTSIDDKKEEILFDVNALAGKHSYYSAKYEVSPDHKWAALAFDTTGRRFYTLKFKDLTTGKFLNQQIDNVTENVVWANDNQTLFYVKQDAETLRWNRVYRYNLKSEKSELVYEETQDTYEVFLSDSLTRRHLFINISSTLSNEVRTLDAAKPEAAPALLFAREKEHEFRVLEDETHYYIQSNKKAKNFRILRTPIEKPSLSNAEVWLEHRNDTFIDGFMVFKSFIALASRENGLTQIEVYNKTDKQIHKLSFQDSAYSVELGANAEYDTKELRYVYYSLRSPAAVYDYDLTTQKSVLRKTKEVPNYNAELYTSERLFASSRDGKKIPISLLMKKGTKLDASSPLLIYGYGSYGVNSDPWFSSNVFSLVSRGFIYAIAHVRGGGEMGRHWTDEGRTLNKKNTFFDFIDATEFLIKEKYAKPDKVFAMGGSAGGLLMGAISNFRPELYRGIIAEVPFVDVLTTMLDDTIPLTTAEYDEWGNPNDKKYYDYMKSYSPYDNVSKQAYPHILVTTGLHDSQVQYWEPAKWVARLRKYNISKSLILLKTDMTSGHGGKSGRFDQLKDDAFEYSFLLGL